MSGHTSGPWEALDKRPDGFTGYSIFSGDQFLAHVGDSDMVTPVDANALLIAAAPELLEALYLAVRAMRAPIDDWKGEVERVALDAARAAIAKATGAAP